MLLCSLRCPSFAATPVAQLFSRIEQQFISGELERADSEATNAEPLLAHQAPDWIEKFTLQHAKIDLYRGSTGEALKLLHQIRTSPATPDDRAAMRSTLLALAYDRNGDLPAARQALAQAEQRAHDPASRASSSVARGHIEEDEGRLEDAERSYTLSRINANAAADPFLQAQAMVNLGVVSLRQEHYEDAQQRFEEASGLSRSIGARLVAEKALGNEGFSYYKLGDFNHALEAAQAAEQEAENIGSLIDQAGLLNDIGLDQFRLHHLAAAQRSYERSDSVARSIADFDEIVDAQVALGFLAMERKNLPEALKHAREASTLANQHLDPSQRFQPALLQAWVLRELNLLDEANQQFLALQRSGAQKASDRWKVERALAELAAARGDAAQADRWFEHAIATFDLQRGTLVEIKARLPFFENGADLYLSYMEQLLHEGRTAEALAILDKSRAVTLTEGLGLAQAKPGLAPQALARRLDGTILVYCLRPGTSYLWAIAPTQSALFRLPGKATILPLLENHNNAIHQAKDLLAEAAAPGRALYDLLVAPAQALLPAHGKVFVIGDEALHALNFETLIPPPDPATPAQPHFWIDDATITNSASLSLLAAAGERRPAERNLLLLGDPLSSSKTDPRLPDAPREIAQVANRFARGSRSVLTGAQATPSAYGSSDPGRYAFIHIVAHGTASDTSPLDAAIILSPTPGSTATNKLYASEILNHHIAADLVTLSTCYGSGKNYSSEGLVGLAWAFLRAGAHNVIASLWEISDAYTPDLMDDLYRQLGDGASPAAALRAAKLAMLHSADASRKPFYWAPFQLYSGA